MARLHTLLFAGTLLVALGCGGKDKDTAKPDTTVTPVVNSNTPGEPWNLDVTALKVPESIVTGKLSGKAFAPDVTLEGTTLSFRTGKEFFADQEVMIQFKNLPATGVPLAIKSDGDFLADAPNITVATRQGNDLPKMQMLLNGYALTLELGAKAKGELPGKIYLCLPGDDKSYIAGTFKAKIKRGSGDPATAEDAPFIQGTVDIGNTKDANLTVGFVGFSTENKTVSNSVGMGIFAGGSVSSTTFEPQITGMTVDKNNVPRFEHTKLPAGRFMVYAILNDKVRAWKWVDVLPDSQMTEKFELKSAGTGTVTVKGVKPENGFDTVKLVPADPLGKVTDLSFMFSASFALKMEGKITGDAASVADVPAGEYVVIGGKKLGTVTVEAGKTATLDATPKPEK